MPVADHLLTRVAVQYLPAGAPVRTLDLRAREGNQIEARVRLARPAFLPPLLVPVSIVRQPVLPDDPVLVLRLGSIGGLMGLAGAAARLLDVLPPGITLRSNILSVDLRAVAARQQVAFALDYLTRLEITTREGQVLIMLRARVPAVARDASLGRMTRPRGQAGR